MPNPAGAFLPSGPGRLTGGAAAIELPFVTDDAGTGDDDIEESSVFRAETAPFRRVLRLLAGFDAIVVFG